MSRELSPPLPDLLYALAEQGGAEDEAGDREGPVWAALLRDGAEVRRELLDQVQAEDAETRNAIDPDDWAALRGAYAVVVRRDNRRNIVAAWSYADEEECLSDWEATRAEVQGSPPAVEAPDTGESTEGPSSGPLTPSSGPLPPRDHD
jgi:hypothetical protein